MIRRVRSPLLSAAEVRARRETDREKANAYEAGDEQDDGVPLAFLSMH